MNARLEMPRQTGPKNARGSDGDVSTACRAGWSKSTTTAGERLVRFERPIDPYSAGADSVAAIPQPRGATRRTRHVIKPSLRKRRAQWRRRLLGFISHPRYCEVAAHFRHAARWHGNFSPGAKRDNRGASNACRAIHRSRVKPRRRSTPRSGCSQSGRRRCACSNRRRGARVSCCAQDGETDIFIYPPYQFRAVDRLLTNFHLPRSTLLMLVAALAGREFILQAYAEAVREALSLL